MVLPTYKAYYKSRTATLWQDITEYVQLQAITYTQTLMQSPLSFNVPTKIPLNPSNDYLEMIEGDFIAITTDSTRTRIADDVLVGVIDNPAKEIIVYDYDNSRWIPEYNIICKEWDFNNNKVKNYNFSSQQLTTILNDILIFSPTQNLNNYLGGVIAGNIIDNYILKLQDFTINSFSGANYSNREALMQLCQQNGIKWRGQWYCEPDSTNLLNIAYQIEIFNKTGLQPKSNLWGLGGITDTTVRRGYIDNPEYILDTAARDKYHPSGKKPSFTSEKDEIVNYVIITGNIVSPEALEDNTDGLIEQRFIAPSEQLFQDTYILKYPALDIKYISRLVSSYITSATAPSATQFSIEADVATLINATDIIKYYAANGETYFREVLSSQGNLLTISALPVTPASGDKIEIVNNHKILDENQNPSFDNEKLNVLVSTITTNATVATTTQFSVESSRSYLLDRGQIVRGEIGVDSEYSRITGRNGDIITVSPAFTLAPITGALIEVTNLTAIPTTPEAPEFAFQDSGGYVFKELQQDQRGRVRFSDLSIPLPGDTISIHYYPITRRKKTARSVSSIQKYGLRKFEKKLDGLYTEEQFTELARQLLIPEPNKTINITSYRPLKVGETIPVDVSTFLTENLVCNQVQAKYIGGCYDNNYRSASEYQITLSTLIDSADEIIRSIERSINVFQPAGDNNDTIYEEKSISIITSVSITKTPASYDTKLVYSELTGGKWRIYVANSDGSGAATISDLTYSEYAGGWDKNYQKIYFTSNASGSFEVWSMDIDGTNRNQITNMTKIVGSCHISAGATDVIFAYEEGATAYDSRYKAYTISKSATSGTGTAITDNAFYTSTAFPYSRAVPYGEFNPVYNPANLNQYAWTGREGSNKYDIVTADPTAVTMNLVYDGQTAGLFGFRPWIDPSGTYIYFLKELSSGGIWEIYRCDNDTSGSNLTGIVTGSDHTYVSISPDNTKILAVRGTAIYSYNLDGSSGTSLVSIGTYFRPQYIEVI